MHILQQKIIDKLRAQPDARYSELMEDGQESSHFKYHLNQLMKDGLVEQLEKGVYALSKHGLVEVDRMTLGKVSPKRGAKPISYILLEDETYYFLYRKSKAPFLNTLNMVSGKQHEGEEFHAAAERELQEKLGVELEMIGPEMIAHILLDMGPEETIDLIGALFRVQLTEAQAQKLQLEPISKSELYKRTDLSPELIPLLELLEEGPTFAELRITL